MPPFLWNATKHKYSQPLLNVTRLKQYKVLKKDFDNNTLNQLYSLHHNITKLCSKFGSCPVSIGLHYSSTGNSQPKVGVIFSAHLPFPDPSIYCATLSFRQSIVLIQLKGTCWNLRVIYSFPISVKKFCNMGNVKLSQDDHGFDKRFVWF